MREYAQRARVAFRDTNRAAPRAGGVGVVAEPLPRASKWCVAETHHNMPHYTVSTAFKEGE
jgi:hypothetical protein